MTNEVFCKLCQCSRTTTSDDGFKHIPEDWISFFVHQEHGARVPLALVCGLHCAALYLATEDANRELRPGAPYDVDRSARTHRCKTCGASHRGSHPGVDWISI